MALSSFWLRHGKKFFKGAALLSIIFMILVLGDLTGIFKNGLLLKFFLTVDPKMHLHHFERYAYQGLIMAFWIVLFSIINLKYYFVEKGYEAIRFNKFSAIGLLILILFFFVIPPPYFIKIESITQYRKLIFKEDGIFEVLTVVFLFLAFLAFILSARISNKKKWVRKLCPLSFFWDFFAWVFFLKK